MNIKIEFINEYHSLYGGFKNRRNTGNAFQSLVSYHFDDSLIFAIIENVNLNNSSLFGLGDTLFFTHTEFEDENEQIKNQYKRIIKQVQEKFQNTVSEYIEWYEMDSVFINVQTDSTEEYKPGISGWRTRIFGNREERDEKDKYGFLNFQSEEKTFLQFVEEYFTYYINLLNSELGFENFPFYTVIVKPISNKNRNETIKLGNLYLHFATREKKDNDFYQRLLNDFLLIWTREEGSIVLERIASETRKKEQLAISKAFLTYLPAIWAFKDDTKFNLDEINKLDEIFGKSGHTLKQFYDQIFILEQVTYLSELNAYETKIIDELIPILLKHRGWLKKGVNLNYAQKVINQIKTDVEHRKFIDFTEQSRKRFVCLLALRQIVNLCFCCFDLQIDEIHSLLAAGSIEHEDRSYDAYITKLTSYFSKLFFFSPKEGKKNILSYTKYDAYNSASLKEIEFLNRCVLKINLLIDTSHRSEYNKKAIPKFALPTSEMKKFDADNVSRLAVFDFKTNWCNENKIIPDLLRDKAAKYLMEPILDCGAGLGDIAYKAFPEKEAILIDVNPIEDKETPTSPRHTHVIKSIFDYFPDAQIRTLLLSHTLQFIDSDLELLDRQIKKINPRNIIIVANMNDDIMGELIKWTESHYSATNCNPEKIIEGFPAGYVRVEQIPFQADVKCRSFEELAKQISYLMMIDLSETGDQLENFLKSKLSEPAFRFNQVIEIYQKP